MPLGLKSSSLKRSARDKAKWISRVSRTQLWLWKRPAWEMKSRLSKPEFWKSRMYLSSTKQTGPVWKARNVHFVPISNLLIRPNGYFASRSIHVGYNATHQHKVMDTTNPQDGCNGR